MGVKNDEMERLYAETFHEIEKGAVLKGKVLSVKQDGVIIDIGYKSDGFIPIEEFSPEELSALHEGGVVDVFVSGKKSINGVINLSRKKAARIKAWDMIEAAFKKETPVEGMVSGKTKGGLSVNLHGIKAFLPSSQIDTKNIKDTDALLNKKMLFKILDINTKMSNVIISRRAILEEEKQKQKTKLVENLKEGAVLQGTVKNITDYGLFIDLGGMDGLLHISDISWGRITHPSDYFSIGDKIDVMVLRYVPEHHKVTLGRKQMKQDPWINIDEKYRIGDKIKGRVVSVADYGIFVEIEDGLEGLVHVSELDWLPKPKHPSKYFSKGDLVEAVVLKADKNERRLSLSTKRMNPSPWELVAQAYKPGQTISGRVKSITDFGVFIGLPEGVDGLVHISDISWTKHIKSPSELIKKGQMLEAVVLNVDAEKERIALGVKQMKPDPWLYEIPAKYKLGDEVKCRVLRATDFGIFVDIEDEVEGLIYASEVLKTGEPAKDGDLLTAKIIKIDPAERKIGLSMKDLKTAGSAEIE